MRRPPGGGKPLQRLSLLRETLFGTNVSTNNSDVVILLAKEGDSVKDQRFNVGMLCAIAGACTLNQDAQTG